MAKANNKLNLGNLTNDERNKLDQKVAELDKEHDGRVMDVTRALSMFLGQSVTRYQIYSLRKTKAVAVRKARNELFDPNTADDLKLDTLLSDILNFDVADFADMYPNRIASELKQLKAEGKPTWLIKKITCGGVDNEDIKCIDYYDKVAVAKLVAQIRGRLKEGNTVRVGTLNNLVVRGDDMFDNANAQLVASEVSNADV